MTLIFPKIIFWSSFLLFSGELLSVCLNKKTTARGFRTSGIWICLTGILFIIFSTKRPPLFGPFEASLYIVFILALLVNTYPKGKAVQLSNTRFYLIHSLVILVVLAVQFNQPLSINDDYYMYDHLWVILFFNLRLISAAFFIHVMVLHLSCLLKGADDTAFFSKTIRYYSLVGIFLYLCSEWSGSFWCLAWFGDSWQWNSGFLKASLLFLVVMATFHLPPSLGRNPYIKTALGSLPGIFALWMLFYL